MQSTLHYGAEASLRIDVPDQALVAACAGPRAAAIADPTTALRAALAAPLDFPPLEQAATPGDRVVIAVGASVPRPDLIVAAVVETLTRHGVDPVFTTILRASADEERHGPDPRRALPAPLREAVRLVVHDPADRRELAYLAATADGRAIYLNRALCDADLLVPISSAQHGPAGGAFAAGVYPTFSDQATAERYRHPNLADSGNETAERARLEAHEVAWLLGLLFAIEVVPAGADQILDVVAGNPDAVAQRAARLYRQAWNWPVPRRASLVVASVTGGLGEQTWDNVGRAISAAAAAVVDDGAICVLSELQDEPGPGVRRLAGTERPASIVRRLRKERPRDMFAALQLAHALERVKVYLLSRLPESVVEELGVAPVEDAEDVTRLLRRHPSCIVLENAQYARAVPETDD